MNDKRTMKSTEETFYGLFRLGQKYEALGLAMQNADTTIEELVEFSRDLGLGVHVGFQPMADGETADRREQRTLVDEDRI